MTVRVNTPELRSLGGQVISVAGDLKNNNSSTEGKLAPAEGAGSAGWATSPAATAAAQGWHDYLNGLVGRLEKAGQSMIDAANNYQSSDDRAANRSGRAAI
ncbi:type VII secretion target [Plantactinospora soyae]|uniref:Uncharacterized protein YukE n=1 Tax=Plantactinospora soyae TaxID=1544732 RepID=A0A927R4N6_9ACTN|nr:type VII secretion target [Plantactinospora soyae]MBE1486704.1 uncharacterized protein YukE [Plantactinospora soyae]